MTKTWRMTVKALRGSRSGRQANGCAVQLRGLQVAVADARRDSRGSGRRGDEPVAEALCSSRSRQRATSGGEAAASSRRSLRGRQTGGGLKRARG